MPSPYPSNPDWPAHWEACTLTGKIVGADGTPEAGATITLTPRPSNVMVPVDDIIVASASILITLDADGEFSRAIPASDDTHITPRKWTYLVEESWGAARKYDIHAPVNQTVDLTQVAPVDSSVGVPYLVGPTGPTGPAGAGIAPVTHVLTAASSVSYPHPFPYPPEVRLVDAGGESVGIGAEYPDSTHVALSFPTPFTGTVILS